MPPNQRTLAPTSKTSRGPTRPQSRLVSTFVAPQRNTGQGQRLAQALGATLQTALSRREKLQKEADESAGIIAGLQASAETDPAKIRTDEMYAQRSDAFMAGLTESQAKAWAYNTVRGWRADYDAWEDRDSNDSRAFTGWASERMAAATAAVGADRFAIAGALPVLRQGLHNLSVGHASYTSKRVKAEELEAMRGIALGMLEGHDWAGDPDGARLVASLEQEAALRVRKGLDETAVNDAMYEDVAAFADARNDVRYLDALAKGHEDGVYRLTAKQLDGLSDAAFKIANEVESIAADQERARIRARNAAEDRALGEFAHALHDDPLTMPAPEIAKASPKLYSAMLSMRSSFNTAVNAVDPRAEFNGLLQVYGVLYAPEVQALPYKDRVAAVAPYLANPDMRLSQATVGSVFRTLAHESDPRSPVNDPTVKALRTSAERMINVVAGYNKKLGIGEAGEMASLFSGQVNAMLVGMDPERLKSPADAQAAFVSVAKIVLTQMLADSDEFRSQIDTMSPVTRRTFEVLGLGDVVGPAEPTAANAYDQVAAAELEAIMAEHAEAVRTAESEPEAAESGPVVVQEPPEDAPEAAPDQMERMGKMLNRFAPGVRKDDDDPKGFDIHDALRQMAERAKQP